MDAVNGDMKLAGVKREEAEDILWRKLIHCGHP